MIQMDKEQIGKIRIEIALGKTEEQVANEFNIPLTRYKKIPRIYPRKAIVRLLFQYSNEKIAQMAQIPIEIVEQIREEQRQQEAVLRIHSALGTPNKKIAEELHIAISTVSGRKRNIRNLYSKGMIINLLKSCDDAEIAKLAQVPIEIIQQVREETQKEEMELRNLIALGLTSSEIARKWNLSSGVLIEHRKANLGRLYTREEIENLLEQQNNIQIAALAQISGEIVSQIREEKVRGRKEKSIKDLTIEEERTIRNLVALGIESEEIAKKLYYNKGSIEKIKFLLGIYSRVQITNLLEDYSDEEISNIANIDVEIVQQIRETMKKQVKNRKYKKEEDIENDVVEIREMTAQGISNEEIVDVLNKEINYIKYLKRVFGVYSRIQILKLLEIKSNDEVAKITEVSIEIIERITEQEKSSQEKKKNRLQAKVQKTEDRKQRGQNLRIAFAKGKTYLQIVHEFNYSSTNSVSSIKKARRILSRREIVSLIDNNQTNEQIAEIARIPIDVVASIRKEIIEERNKLMDSGKTNEEIAQIAQIPIELVIQIREEKHRANQLLKKECKEQLQQLNEEIKSLKEGDIPKKIQKGIKKQILELLKKYQKILTMVDYSFIAYTYLKIGMRQECQEIAQYYLAIENASMEEVVRRISAILEAERFRRETPIILIAPNRHKEMEER